MYWRRQEIAGLAYSLAGLADVAIGRGSPSRRRGGSERWRPCAKELKAPLPPCDLRDWNCSVAAVRGAPNASFIAAAWTEGRAIPLLELLAGEGVLYAERVR